jgi:polyisoprenoid-binding protein YceI
VAALAMLSVAALARGDGAATSAAAPMTVAHGPGSTLWLEGTSTLHDFESRTSAVGITLTADAAVAHPADAAALLASVKGSGVHDVTVTVPVRSLHSGKDGLDKNLWKDLQADAHPLITFHLGAYAARSQDPGDTLAIHAEGTLEIAGHARPIQLEARAWRDDAGLWLVGSEPLLMSEYGIHPPTMMLGTLKVADRITVHYRLLLAPKADAAAGPATGEEGGKR